MTDVPEWFAKLWKFHFPFTPLDGRSVKSFAGNLEAEIACRMAELGQSAEDDRDRAACKIAELEAKVERLSQPVDAGLIHDAEECERACKLAQNFAYLVRMGMMTNDKTIEAATKLEAKLSELESRRRRTPCDGR